MSNPISNRPFDEYRYSAFFSYSLHDDAAWNQWVSCFKDELLFSLPARLRGIKVREIHLSGKNPLVSGHLSEQLEKNVNDSFAMFLFVHDNYVNSEWCLKELEYFKSYFGEEGFRTRLYVIAMSKEAIDELMARDTWKNLCPYNDQLWVPFFKADPTDFPINIYAGDDNVAEGKRRVVSNAFWESFVRIREQLAKKIRDVVAESKQLATAPPPEDPKVVRVYIEANERHETYWAPLASQVTSSWDQLAPDFSVEPCRLYVRPTGLPMNEVDKRPFLDDADGVVLLWDKRTPDSLVPQITKVEKKLRGKHAAPGIIAYLMEPGGQPPAENRVSNWPVLKFEPDSTGQLHIAYQDGLALGAFLSQVLERKRLRLQAGAPSAEIAQ